MITFDHFRYIFPDATADDYADTLTVMIFAGAARNAMRAATFLSMMSDARAFQEIGVAWYDCGFHGAPAIEIGEAVAALTKSLRHTPRNIVDRMRIFDFAFDRWH